MIVVGQTPQPDAALKILTPWWDVLCRYLSGGIFTIALTATAIQAAKDDLVCIPAVDCGGSSPQTQTALMLKTDVCSQVKYQDINNDTTTTILTTMNDYRSYSFVDSSCFQKTLHWYPAYFPFILVVEALLLLVIDNFWIMYPKTSSGLSHFVALVTDCYKSVGTLSDIIHVISQSEKKKQAVTGKGKSPKDSNVEDVELAVVDSGKTPKSPDEPSGSQEPQTSGKHSIPFDVSEAVKVKALYERVENFKKWYERTHTLMGIYVLRGVIQILFSLFVLIFNSYFYQDLGDNINCQLKELFIMKYEYFVCSRFIAPYYRAFTFIFAIPFGAYFLTSLYAFMWTFWSSKRFNLFSGIEFVDHDLNVKGDMSFLFSLLEEYDKLYAMKFSIFLSTAYKEKVEDRISAMYAESVEENNDKWFTGLRKLLPTYKTAPEV